MKEDLMLFIAGILVGIAIGFSLGFGIFGIYVKP